MFKIRRQFDVNLHKLKLVTVLCTHNFEILNIIYRCGFRRKNFHSEFLHSQEIDGKALFLLSFDELESLTENKLGPITKLKDALQSLKKMWQIPLTKTTVTT